MDDRGDSRGNRARVRHRGAKSYGPLGSSSMRPARQIGTRSTAAPRATYEACRRPSSRTPRPSAAGNDLIGTDRVPVVDVARAIRQRRRRSRGAELHFGVCVRTDAGRESHRRGSGAVEYSIPTPTSPGDVVPRRTRSIVRPDDEGLAPTSPRASPSAKATPMPVANGRRRPPPRAANGRDDDHRKGQLRRARRSDEVARGLEPPRET